MSSSPSESTPEPIKAAAATVGALVSLIVGALGYAVTLGIVSGEQAEALATSGNALLGALPELVAAISLVVGLVAGLAASFATAWRARAKTVPVASDVFTVTGPNGPPPPE